MQIVQKRLEELHPYKANPRINGAAVPYVAQSIYDFGFKVPLVIDRKGVIIAGHTRYKAAQQLGMDEVPCIVADDLTDEQVQAFRIADNKVAEIAEWDDSLLDIELQQLEEAGIDMGGYGFDIDMGEADIDMQLEEVSEDGYDPDGDGAQAPGRVRKGDIWKLGDHRLMCGDSTDAEQVERLMGGELADMLLTDPPYNVALGHHMRPSEAKQLHRRTDGLVIDNDSWESDEEFQGFLRAAFSAALDSMRPGAAFYIWHASSQSLNFNSAARDVGMQIRQVLIWVKSTFALGRQDYQWQHEPCLYGWKGGAAHYFVDDRRRATVIEDARPNIKSMKASEMRALLEDIFSDRVSTTVLHEDKPSRSEEHPTMKPVKLMARQVLNSSKEGQSVLDLFGGSGSTMMACEQLGRRCFTMELDEHYCDVILDRWERATGLEAEKVSGK